MFRVSASDWIRLDKEAQRLADSEPITLNFMAEVFPASEGVELEEAVRRLAEDNSGMCELQYDVHEEHGDVYCSKDVEPGALSDFLNQLVRAFAASDQVYLGSFQAELRVDDALVALIFGNQFKGTAILPDSSGKSLNVLELEFSV